MKAGPTVKLENREDGDGDQWLDCRECVHLAPNGSDLAGYFCNHPRHVGIAERWIGFETKTPKECPLLKPSDQKPQ